MTFQYKSASESVFKTQSFGIRGGELAVIILENLWLSDGKVV